MTSDNQTPLPDRIDELIWGHSGLIKQFSDDTVAYAMATDRQDIDRTSDKKEATEAKLKQAIELKCEYDTDIQAEEISDSCQRYDGFYYERDDDEYYETKLQQLKDGE